MIREIIFYKNKVKTKNKKNNNNNNNNNNNDKKLISINIPKIKYDKKLPNDKFVNKKLNLINN